MYNTRNVLIVFTDIYILKIKDITLKLRNFNKIYSIILLGNKLLFVNNKEQAKIYIKSFLYRLFGVLIPLLTIVIYLISNNAFQEFINYTIKGTREFSNYVPYNDLFNVDIIGLLSILIPLVIIYEIYKLLTNHKMTLNYFLLVYGLGMFIIAFPISDTIHFLIGGSTTINIINL